MCALRGPFWAAPATLGPLTPSLGGRRLYGPPRYPLPRLRLEAEGDTLYATGHEVPLRPMEGS